METFQVREHILYVYIYIYTQDTLQVGRFITPESLEDARFRKSFFYGVNMVFDTLGRYEFDTR